MAANNPTILIRGICERDIDLLLLEEIAASPQFRRWVLEKLRIQPDAELLQVERSVATASGESDLELTLCYDGRMIKALIENKVDAPLQPDQAKRYYKRALTYQECGACERVVTAVVALAVYFDDQTDHGFDVLMRYEDVLDYFESATDLGMRRAYKLAALREAIDRGRRGWKLVPDDAATSFWQRYWELAGRVAPSLRMPKPEAKPATSNFIRFRPLGLQVGVELYHKVPYGRVDLQFAGMGTKLESIQEQFGDSLSPNMHVEKAAKSAAIRVYVPEVDMAIPFEESQKAVEEALSAAAELLKMYQTSIATK